MNTARTLLAAVAAALGALGSGPASAASGDLQWQAANGRPCAEVCNSAGLQPVQSGVHSPGGRATKDAFYICATNMNGFRPGYNLQPKWSKACWVGYGGKEVAAKNYVCACSGAAPARTAAAAPAAASAAAGKLGQERPYGQPVGPWKITVTEEKPGVVNCRAVRKAGQRLDIMAMRNNGTDPYLSVEAEGRNGKFPGTIINVPGQPPGVQEWQSDGEANGKRMWFPLGAVTISELADAGAFQFSLPDSEDSGVVLLGKDAPAAWNRVNDCVFANGR